MKTQIKLFDVPQIESISDLLFKSAERFSNKLALEDLTNTPISKVTFNELLQNVLKFGNGLMKLGLQERSHIGVISENRVQWGIAYLTCAVFNYVVVPIDKNLNENEILNILHESEADAIIFSDSFNSIFEETHLSLKKLKHFISMDLLQKKGSFLSMPEIIRNNQPEEKNKIPKINPEEMSEIIFTSGALGRAKGVMLTQKNIAANLMSMTKMISITEEDRFLSVLPIHHTYECTCGFLCPMFSGSSVHYARSLKTVVDDLQAVKATILLGVPLLYEKMYKRISKTISEDKIKSRIVPPLIKLSGTLERLGIKKIKRKLFSELHERFGGSIRLFFAGGAAPDPQIAKGLRDFGFAFIQGYGLTETSPILALNQLENFKDEAAGLPLPGVELKIVNPDNDGAGEIYAKGNNVMLGYYKNETLTKDTLEDSWFKTGDIGFIDEDGFLHISGRKKNVIIANNGKNVFPEEIEDLLNRSRFILESLVYGEEDKKHDEIIAVQIVTDTEAFIEYSEKNNIEITPESINKVISNVIKEVNKELAGYKQIKKFYIRESEFEKTTTQKIKRYLVKKNGDGSV